MFHKLLFVFYARVYSREMIQPSEREWNLLTHKKCTDRFFGSLFWGVWLEHTFLQNHKIPPPLWPWEGDSCCISAQDQARGVSLHQWCWVWRHWGWERTLGHCSHLILTSKFQLVNCRKISEAVTRKRERERGNVEVPGIYWPVLWDGLLNSSL